jgi:hypothetical protein
VEALIVLNTTSLLDLLALLADNGQIIKKTHSPKRPRRVHLVAGVFFRTSAEFVDLRFPDPES